jgi:hypothetical protein
MLEEWNDAVEVVQIARATRRRSHELPPSILTVSAVARLSLLARAAPFRNVGGVGEAPPVNTRPAPAIVPKVEFDCVFGHNAKPAATSFQPFEVLKALSNVEGLSALSYRERRQNTEDSRQHETRDQRREDDSQEKFSAED